MIDNYKGLKESVQNWLDSDEPELIAEIPNFIRFAENELYRELRIPPFERLGREVVTSGMISIPSDILEFKHLYTTKHGTLKQDSIDNIYRHKNTFVRIGRNLILSKDIPDGTTVLFTYYGEPEIMKLDEDKSELLKLAPELLLYTALRHAAVYEENDMAVQKFGQLAAGIFKGVVDLAEDFEYSAAPLQVMMPKSLI